MTAAGPPALPHAILRPAVLLVLWTLVMLGWGLARRLPALWAKGIRLRALSGGRGADADRVLPPRAQWPVHNYNHLLEQPVLFYAACGALALAGAGDRPAGVALAWSYLGLRVAHSLVQATWNRVLVRFALFVLSSLCLAALGLVAAAAAFA